MDMEEMTLQEILSQMKDKSYNHRIKSKKDLRLLHKAYNQLLESIYQNDTKSVKISITTKKPEQT